jgi:hypothetical protein
VRQPVIAHGDEELELDYLPRWRALDQVDRENMVRWVNGRLDELERADWHAFERSPKLQLPPDWFDNLGPEIDSAEQGFIEPLRRKLPHLAKFLYLPKKEHGKGTHRKPKNHLFVQAAARDVVRIKQLWLTHYNKKYRRVNDGPSEFEIAAERWLDDDVVTVKQVKEAHKRLSEPSRRRS